MAKDKVVKASSTSVAPSYLSKWQGRTEGKEQFEKEDIILPRITIAQSLSPQLQKDDAAFIEGLEQGDLFNNLTQEIYGSSIEVIPLLMYKSGFNALPISDGGGIVCTSEDSIHCDKYGTCKSRDWSDDEEGNRVPPECDLVRNFIMCLPDAKEIALMSISRTSTPAGRRLISLAAARGEFPLFACKFTINTSLKIDGKFKYYVLQANNAGFTPEGLMEFVEEKYTSYKKMVQEGKVRGHEELEPEPIPNNDTETPF